MLLSSLKNLMLIRTDLIFYILAVVFFCGFIVALIIYLHTRQQNPNSKPTKSWTIESAKKFLESNNISVKENINENLAKDNATKTTTAPKTITKKPVTTKPATKVTTTKTVTTNATKSAPKTEKVTKK